MVRLCGLAVWLLCSTLPSVDSSLLQNHVLAAKRRTIVESLLNGSNVQGQIYAALHAENMYAADEQPQRHLHVSLANLHLPVPPEVRDLAAKADGSMKISPGEADRAAEKLNKMLLEQQVVLDHKIIECRGLRHRTGEAIQNAADEVRRLASETSDARSHIVDAASRIPQDRRSFYDLKVEGRHNRKQCEGARMTFTVKSAALAQDRAKVAALQDALERQCQAAFLQESSPNEATNAKRTATSGASGCSAMAAGLGVVARRRNGSIAASFLQSMQPLQCKLNVQDCDAMKDVVAEVVGEIEDSQARLKANAAKSRQDCDDAEHFLEKQLSMETGQASERSRELGEASVKAAAVGELANQKDSERQKLQAELKATTAKCNADINNILYGTMCTLRKVRDNLQILAGRTELPEDCQVTDWDEGMCTKTCGGGSKILSRKVISSPSGGAACPPLTLTLACGEAECPKECEVSAWTGWSACSAHCNGGVQERNRVVVQQPVGNGVACPHLVDMQLCNTDSCSSDCDMLEWTTWTPCSRACDGGTSMRTRALKDEGRISCPKSDSNRRLEFQDCNMEACDANKDAKCSGAPLDVVLLLDVSGSMTDAGVDTLKALTTQLIDSYALSANGTQMSIAAFAKESVAISSLSADASQLTSRLASRLRWLKGPGNAGAALSRASSLLAADGRKEVSSLVLMITDGRIVDPFFARQVAERLKMTGVRLAFALVGQEYLNPGLLSTMASAPDKDNTIQLPGLEDLRSQIKSVASHIVSSTCSKVI